MTGPKHIAIIMDGNGRWANRRSHARAFGHVKGARRVRDLTRYCARQGLTALTLYTFSAENWNRPESEVRFLMKLLLNYLKTEREEILKNNIQFRVIGSPEQMPEKVQLALREMETASQTNTGMFLNLALSYGGRQELTLAMQRIARKVAAGEFKVEQIDSSIVEQHLHTSHLPDPDLLIRTGGDQRISNFLLWQLAYTELYFVDKAWPDFTIDDLESAIAVFNNSERRFGLTGAQIKNQDTEHSLQ